MHYSRNFLSNLDTTTARYNATFTSCSFVSQNGNRDSVVGIATWHGADSSEFESRQRKEILSSRKASRPSPDPNKSPVQCVSAFSVRIKAAGG